MKNEIFVILNPVSGVRKNKAALKQLIQKKLQDLNPEIYETTGRGDAARAARTARERNMPIVVAAGGDGTVNEIAAELQGTETALGIIPCGSGNGLARSLQIPLNIPHALKILHNPGFKKIDIGRAGPRFFCNAAGFGIDASISFGFEKSRRRGFLGYVWVTAKEFYRFQPREFCLEIADQKRTCFPFLLVFANTPQYGNGAYIAPQANVDDGLFDLCLIENVSKLQILASLPTLFRGTLNRHALAEYLRVAGGRISVAGEFAYHVDGEPVKARDGIEIELLPRALKVCVPRNGRA